MSPGENRLNLVGPVLGSCVVVDDEVVEAQCVDVGLDSGEESRGRRGRVGRLRVAVVRLQRGTRHQVGLLRLDVVVSLLCNYSCISSRRR